MKIKFIGSEVDPDISLNLVDDLVKNGIITDRDEQILGIYENEVQLDGIYPSQELSDVMVLYPDWKLNTDPSETDAFEPEDGLSDEEKIGSVPDPTYKDEEGEELIEELKNIELFPESETTFSEKSGEKDTNINSFNNKSMQKKRKNFDDPAVNEEGVAVVATQTEVEATQDKDDANYDPAEEGFSSVDVAPFTDEEIEKANDVEVDSDEGEITVFSDEEIEEMVDPDEVEKLADEMETEENTFAERKKRLFSAKRRLRKVNSRRSERKSFAEELSESEKSAVIEDIVAILEDAPEIKDAVAEEVEGLVTADADEHDVEVTEDVVETPVVETPVEETTEEVTEETTEEPAVEETVTEETVETPAEEEEVEEDEDEDLEVEAFSDEEIEEAPETEVVETEEQDETETFEEHCNSEDAEEESEGDEIGRVFCKAFCEDPVKSFRREQLAKMAESQTGYGRHIR